jgi:hypothetical protein
MGGAIISAMTEVLGHSTYDLQNTLLVYRGKYKKPVRLWRPVAVVWTFKRDTGEWECVARDWHDSSAVLHEASARFLEVAKPSL